MFHLLSRFTLHFSLNSEDMKVCVCIKFLTG
jgi:hypothetical protein